MANPSPLLFSIIALIVVTSIIWIAFWMIDDRKVDTLWGLDKNQHSLFTTNVFANAATPLPQPMDSPHASTRSSSCLPITVP